MQWRRYVVFNKGAFTLLTSADASIAGSRDDFSRGRWKIDEVSKRQSPATMELWTYARRHWRYASLTSVGHNLPGWHWTLVLGSALIFGGVRGIGGLGREGQDTGASQLSCYSSSNEREWRRGAHTSLDDGVFHVLWKLTRMKWGSGLRCV
jgi:hypothetical protein